MYLALNNVSDFVKGMYNVSSCTPLFISLCINDIAEYLQSLQSLHDEYIK